MTAWTSPARTSRSTPDSAWTPGNRLTIPRATRSGSVLTLADDGARGGLIEQLVLVLDVLRHLLAAADLGDGVEQDGAHQRVALDGRVELAGDHGLEGGLHRVHRDDDHVRAGLHPRLVEGLDRTERHVIVVRV